jgi:hypothetical protein
MSVDTNLEFEAEAEAITTFCGNRCDEIHGQCLNCSIDETWRKIIQGESSKGEIDTMIAMKIFLIGCIGDTDAVDKLKKEVQALYILRDRQKE